METFHHWYPHDLSIFSCSSSLSISLSVTGSKKMESTLMFPKSVWYKVHDIFWYFLCLSRSYINKTFIKPFNYFLWYVTSISFSLNALGNICFIVLFLFFTSFISFQIISNYPLLFLYFFLCSFLSFYLTYFETFYKSPHSFR